jgi:pyruvate, orthophosphate dikinase
MSRVDRIAFIGEGQSDVHLLVADAGLKGVNLARLDHLGLRVPPALVLNTALADDFHASGALPAGFAVQLTASLRQLEDATGLTLGGSRPLLLSVRSSPVVAMPGMLDTLLNVGLTEATVPRLIRRTGNPWLAWDCYRRLVRAFAEAGHHFTSGEFERLTADHLARAGARELQELDPISMRDLACDSAALLRGAGPRPLPEDPVGQVVRAVELVLGSWNAPRAQEYRRICGVDERAGMAVVIQAMVLGNGGAHSGSGVGFTRNPANGADELYVDFVFNAQGDDVVSGREAVHDGDVLPKVLPDIWHELERVRPLLEREFADMQDFEFTVEDGELFFLETHQGKRTPWAAARIAVDLVRSGIMDPPTALRQLAPYDLKALVRRSVTRDNGSQPIARAIAAGPGAATGGVVFDVERARQRAVSEPVILVRPRLGAGDLPGIAAADGVLTATGGRTSHAAVVARQLGKVCLVGCTALHVDEPMAACMLGSRVLHEGDVITIDGDSGLIYAGPVDVVADRPDEALAIIESWRRQMSGAATSGRSHS